MSSENQSGHFTKGIVELQKYMGIESNVMCLKKL